MRISTRQIAFTSINAILDRQRELNKVQLQISTGKRVNVPSDDPAAAKRIMDIGEIISINKQYQKNADLAESRLGIEDAALTNVIDIIQRARDLTLQANSDLLGAAARNNIAVEITQLQEQLLDSANTKDSNGEYIFSGFKGTTVPFSRTSTNAFSYSGDAGQRFLQIGPSRQIAVGDAGTSVFRKISTGNGSFSVGANSSNSGNAIIDAGTVITQSTWSANSETYQINFTSTTNYEVRDAQNTLVTSGTYVDDGNISFQGIQVSIGGTPASGDQFTISPSVSQDIFTTLENLKTALGVNPSSLAGAAQASNLLNAGLENIDQAMDNIINIQGSVGARLNSIDRQRSNNDSLIFESKKILSKEEDLDITTAISDLNLELTGLEVSQQVFVRVQNLSLFNFL